MNYDFTNSFLANNMDPLFEDFKRAYVEGDGYGLSMTLSPIPPISQPERLQIFYRSTNFAQVQKDFRYRILHDTSIPFQLPIEESNGWVEVYHTYWKAVGELLDAEKAQKANAKVQKIF